jgi:hypothetical protein
MRAHTACILRYSDGDGSLPSKNNVEKEVAGRDRKELLGPDFEAWKGGLVEGSLAERAHAEFRIGRFGIDGDRTADQRGDVAHASARRVGGDAGERGAQGGGDFGSHRVRPGPPCCNGPRCSIQPRNDPPLLV